MIELQTRYITADEFRQYFGIDLMAELPDESYPSDKANAFLKRIEDRMEAFINANFAKNVTSCYTKFSNEQKRHYKLALLEQAFYVYRNGDVSTDSGADEDGVKIDRAKINQLSIAPNAQQQLIMCGLWNRHLQSNEVWWGWVLWQSI